MSRPRLAPFGVAVLAVSICAAAFPIGNALIGDRDRQQPRITAAAAAGADDVQAAGAGRLTTATSCGDLLNTMTAEASKLVGPWGWEYYAGYWGRDLAAVDGVFSSRTANLSGESVSSSKTGTNVQEAGIDEPDFAKTDGRILVRVDGLKLRIFDLTADPKRPKPIATLRLPHALRFGAELLLAGDRLLAVASAWRSGASRTAITSIDVSDPAKPTVQSTRWIDGELLSARLSGDVVRLVTSSGLPDLDFVRPNKNRTRKQAKAQNKKIVAATTIDDWLPKITVGDESKNLLDCSEVNVPEELSGVGILSVVGFPTDVADPAEGSATGVLTQSRTVYTATDRLYLATGNWCCSMLAEWGDTSFRRTTTPETELHSFALDGAEASYLASGSVRGTVPDRWAMDSADGVLRVAVSTEVKHTTGKGKNRRNRTRSSTSVITLGERAGQLVELGSVDGLGVDEHLQSVRWFDDSAYLVTFRQIDPLYAIDLSEPKHPRLVGELKIPGFSSYLHPIGDDRLLGLGTDATRSGRSLGAQASVFDVADPGNPKQADKTTYGRSTEFGASWEPRQFTWLPEQRTALAVLNDWGGRGYGVKIVALRIAEDGRMQSVSVRLKHGWGASNARTLPLDDGRVVVTSRADTEFLEW